MAFDTIRIWQFDDVLDGRGFAFALGAPVPAGFSHFAVNIEPRFMLAERRTFKCPLEGGPGGTYVRWSYKLYDLIGII